MSLRNSSLLLALSVVVSPLVFAAPATAQSTNGRWVIPRTANGHPDLQGNWSNATMTPIQRRRDQDSAVLALDEAKRGEQAKADRYTARAQPSDPNRPAPPVGGDGSTGQQHERDQQDDREPGEQVRREQPDQHLHDQHHHSARSVRSRLRPINPPTASRKTAGPNR